MTWFLLALAPPWMFFTVVGINLVAAILEGRDDERAPAAPYVMPPHERAMFIPGSADLDDLLGRLAASRK